MNCVNCGREAAPGDTYCRNCGARLVTEGADATRAGTPSGMPNVGGGGAPYAPRSGPSSPSEPKDPTLAFVLEVLPGLFGVLGIGHMYAGYINRGVVLLVVWAVFVLAEVSTGVICCFFPLNLIVPVLSGYWVRREMDGQPVPWTR